MVAFAPDKPPTRPKPGWESGFSGAKATGVPSCEGNRVLGCELARVLIETRRQTLGDALGGMIEQVLLLGDEERNDGEGVSRWQQKQELLAAVPARCGGW